MNHQILNYRPEIDGLRAIAVISVIIYHIEFFISGKKILTGGFLGVDIFFVISGYLITLLIVKEFLKDKKISFKNFYFRRAKRIFPALLFMISVSIFFAWIYLTPDNFIQYSNSIISSIFFYSNYFFYFEGLVYNSNDSLLKPLLHTWSLAVEEQFYILFPLFFVLFYRYIEKNLIQSFAIILVLFFVAAILITGSNNSFGFYSNFSRMWEILFGSLLAILEIKEKRISLKFEKFLPNLGFVLIILSLVFFDNDTIHPSYLTFFPILGVFLIIHFIESNNLIFKFLTNRIISKIGIWSYSLYLWHFPIFAFARNRGKSLSDFDKLELLGLTLIFSILSFYLVEKPFRKIQYKDVKKFTIFIIFVVSLLCAFSYHAQKNKGFEDRVHVFLKNHTRENLWSKVTDKDGRPCFDRNKDFCNLNQNQKKSLILVGDSHLEQLSYSILKNLNNEYNLVSMNRGGCIYLPDTEKRSIKDGVEYWNCTLESKILIDEILKSRKNSIILIGGNFKEHLFTKTDWKYVINKNITLEENFKRSIFKLLNNNKVILIYPVPTHDFNLLKRVMNEVPKSTFKATAYLEKNPFTTNYSKYLKENKKIINFFDEIKDKNLFKVYPDQIFCENIKEICFSHKGKDLYYYDKDHLTILGADKLSIEIIKIIKKIDLNKN